MSAPRKWLRSFRYAYEGLIYALSTQRNMKFHFIAALSVLLLALFFDLSRLEILFIILAITLILVTELVNTAIERAVDLAMPDLHPIAKIAKDVAAAAVLVTAIFAVIVGLIVFFEPINSLLSHSREHSQSVSVDAIWLFAGLVVLSVIIIQTRFTKKRKNQQPSLLAALSFSLSTMIVLYASELFVGLLAFALSLVTVTVLYEKTERSFASLLLGGLIGVVITALAYFLVQSV